VRRTRRILLSSRDPGGVGHVLALLATFRERGGFDADVVASGVALQMLREAGESAREFTLDDGRDTVLLGQTTDGLLSTARKLLDDTHPDVVLGSLSSYGVGVDEALVATARCPTLIMQDFWGDTNLGLGVAAGLYLALDDFAVRLTRQRWNLPAVAVGSPKHSRYERLDVVALRRNARATVGLDDSEQVVGFFGQSPEIPGYEAAFCDFVHAVAELRPQPLFLVREHLKFHTRREAHIRTAGAAGLRVVDVSDQLQVEPWLAACDVVATPFSLCALDHAYLSAYSTKPIGVVLFLLPNKEIQHFMEHACGLKQFPTVEKGMGAVARHVSEIVPLLEEARRPLWAGRYFEASWALRDEHACSHIVDIVESQTA
jgi:hypothetical protein